MTAFKVKRISWIRWNSDTCWLSRVITTQSVKHFRSSMPMKIYNENSLEWIIMVVYIKIKENIIWTFTECYGANILIHVFNVFGCCKEVAQGGEKKRVKFENIKNLSEANTFTFWLISLFCFCSWGLQHINCAESVAHQWHQLNPVLPLPVETSQTWPGSQCFQALGLEVSPTTSANKTVEANQLCRKSSHDQSTLRYDYPINIPTHSKPISFKWNHLQFIVWKGFID